MSAHLLLACLPAYFLPPPPLTPHDSVIMHRGVNLSNSEAFQERDCITYFYSSSIGIFVYITCKLQKRQKPLLATTLYHC